MAYNIRDVMNMPNQDSGNYSGQLPYFVNQPSYGGQQPAWMSGMQNYYNQVAQANQQLQQDQGPSWLDKGRDNSDNYRYRQMNDVDRFFGGLNSLTNTLSGGASEALGLGTFNPDEGFTGENLARFAVNLPGQLLSSIPDAAVHAAEVITGTPFTEADTDAGLIPDYNMGLDQRAASLGYLGLDALGFIPGLGPEARAAGLLAKGVGYGAKLAGKEAAADAISASGRAVSQGIVKDAGRLELAAAASGAGKGVTRAAKIGDSAIDIAASSAFEGAQEAGQNLFEDMRYRQFDDKSWERAANAGAWGAIGGGIVSGTSNAVNAFGKQNASDPVTDPQQNTSPQFEREKDRNRTEAGGAWTTSAMKRIAELSRDDNEIPGSTSALSTVIDNSNNLTQCGIGENSIHAMLQADDNGASAEAIADRFGITVDELMRIDSKANASERVQLYNDLIARQLAAGKPVNVVIGRNPDTSLGTALFNVNSVFLGDGVHMNRQAYMMFGGDVDGDKSQVYFGKGAQHNGYLTKNLRSAATGVSRLNGDYMLFGDTQETLDAFDGMVDALFADYDNANTQYFKDAYRKCFEDGKADVESISELFDNMRSYLYNLEINNQKRAGVQDIDYDATDYKVDGEIANLMYEVESRAVTMPQRFVDVVTKLTDDEQAAVDELYRVMSDAGDKYLTSGDTAGAKHFAEFAAQLGYKIAANTNLGNPFFRQAGQVYYHAQKDQNMWFGGIGTTQLKNIYDQLIAFSFRLTEVGGDVENSIEGIWRTTVQDEVMSRLVSSGLPKVDISTGWNDFIDAFVEVHDEYVTTFNRALQVPTTRDEHRSVLNAATKKQLSSVDNKVRDKATARAFMEIFGEYYFNDIFNIPETHPMYGKTFSQGVEEYAVHAGRWNGMFANYQGFNAFWRTLLEDYSGKNNALGKRVENTIDGIAQQLRSIGNHISKTTVDDNETWVIEPDYMDSMSEIIDALNLLISPDSAIRLNLSQIDSFINTAWGRALLSGDESRMKKALISIQLTDQYESVIDIVSNHDINEDPAWRNQAVAEASKLADNSRLHMAIFVALDKYGDVGILRRMTDLDVSYEDNLVEYARLVADNYGSAGLMASALKSTDTEMSISAVSNRLKQVNRVMASAAKKTREFNIEIVNRIRNSIDVEKRYTVVQAEEAMREFAKQEYVEASSDAVASFVYSQRDIVKEMVDKGTATGSSSAIYQQVANIWQGGNLSWIDQLGIELGNMSVGNFQTNRIQLLRVLTDPEAEIRLWDPMQDGFIILTQQSLFEEVGINIDKSGPAVGQLLEFLERVPQMASIIAPSKLDIISDGSNNTMTAGTDQLLDVAIQGWVNRGQRTQAQLSEPAQRKKVKQLMFQDPDWWGMLIASTDSVSSNLTLEQTKYRVNQAIEDHIDFFMEYARMNPGENYEVMRQAYFSDTYSMALQQATDLMNDLSMVQKYMQLTGRIHASAANDAAFSSLGMYKMLAVNKLFTDNGYQIDFTKMFDLGFSADQIGSISDILTKYGQTYLDLGFALMNLVDSNDLSFDSYLRAGRFDNFIQDELEKITQSDPDKAAKIQEEMDSWGNGLSGFVKYMTGSAENLKPTEFVSDLVITDAAIPSNGNPGWTEQQWVDHCEKIMDRCARLDDFGEDAKKDIRDKIAEGDYARIKAYYNNVIVGKLYGDLTFGSGQTINLDSMQQTIDAKKHMIDMADRIKAELKKNYALEERDARNVTSLKLPEIRFNYADPATAYMATSGVMNAQSGSVGSGIGVDGAMTKAIAAFGALPPDADCGTHGTRVSPSDVNADEHIGWNYMGLDGKVHRIRNADDVLQIQRGASGEITLFNPAHCLSWSCSKCSPASRSSSTPRINMVSYALSELANWMQEARHLQAKKTVGFAGLISDGLETQSDLMQPMQFRLGDGTDVADGVRQGLLDILFERRAELADYWNSKFMEAKKLPLDMEHAIAFSNATTPIIEVVTNDDQTVYVSVHDLADAATFSAKYPTLAEGQITTCRPIVMSLQEVASKIIRGICNEYYKPENIGSFTKQDIHDAAKNAVEDWSSYNSSKIDLSRIISGIVSRAPSYGMGVAADATPSARMRWNDSAYDSISSLFRSSKWVSKPMTDEARRLVSEANESMKGLGLPSGFVIAHYSSDNSGFYSNVKNVLSRLAFSENQDGNESMIRIDDSDKKGVEVFECETGSIGSDVGAMADEAHKRAAENNRAFMVSVNAFNRMKSLSYSEKVEAIYLEVGGKEFIIVEPSINDQIAYYRRSTPQMAIEELSPDEITVAVATEDRLQLPDGGHYTRRDYRPTFMYRGTNNIPVRSLLRGTDQILLVSDYAEVAQIIQDDIDYSYYEKLSSYPNEDFLRQSVDNFIASARSKTGNCKTISNVTRDSCIGFVKQQRGTRTVYAPLFYSGSIPSTASSVNVRLSNGQVNLTYMTDQIDYNGNESMKLDLYGVAYKSVGHMVSQDMQDQYWSAIDDCGFNAVTSPEHMFDYHALAGRVFNMSDSVVQNNLFYYSRKVGVNLLFEVDNDGVIKRKHGLNVAISDGQLSDLANGSQRAWSKVASGEIVLFSNIDGNQELTNEMNEVIRNITSELLISGGHPDLFFNSREITMGEDGKWVDHGIWPRDMTFRIATKYLNRDKTLKLFHLLDKRLCPNGWDAGASDSMDTVFDRSGKMIDKNTLSGNPERVYALVGPHYYTGQGTAIGNLSRDAQYSNQHMIKRMMELGVYPPQINDLVEYLSMQTGQSSNYNQTAAERLQKMDLGEEKRLVNQDAYDAMALTLSDPINLIGIDRYREKLSSMLEEVTRRLPVTMDDLKTDAFTDAFVSRQLDSALASLNEACGKPSSTEALTMDEVLQLVRFEVGFTENDGRGTLRGLTYNQVINSINRMKENISEGGLLIKGGTFQGARGDLRGHIPMLPAGLNARLMMLPKIHSYYKGDVKKMLADQESEMKTVSLPAFQEIENDAKRKALYRFADAVFYANGKDTVSGHVLDDVYMPDLVKAIKEFGAGGFSNYDPAFVEKYEELTKLSNDYVEKLKKLATSHRSSVITDANGNRNVVFTGDQRNFGTYILRTLSNLRKTIGMSYAFMLPANVAERYVNQGMQSIALTLGQTKLGPYASNSKVDPKIAKQAVKDAEFKKLYAALRSAELVGSDRDLLVRVRNGQDLDSAIEEVLRSKGAFERFQEKFMNIMSGKDIAIEGQMRNFIDRFAQRTEKDAPWWTMKANGSSLTILEQQLEQNPSKWFIDVMNGSSDSTGADMILARQCLNWAKRGDMAQKNVVSAIYSEIASRHAGFEFFTTAFISPYFQYATNRLGRLMNWVAPISSIHYVVTDFLTNGAGRNLPIGKDLKFGDLALEDVQFQANLKEALIIDMLHLGPQIVAFVLMGMAGAIEPPEDEDKWGNFKEWTIFGLRTDVAWWLEDILGLALPVAVFGKSAQLGKPRLDIIVNGLGYYLSNNPVTKVADAVTILMDPMSELQRDYDKDLEGYAKAMAGPPQLTDIVNGKLTSMGLSFVSQFITPGFVREIYNGSIDFEPSYKRVYETDATGRLTEEAKTNNKTEYTTYQDAVVRKFTKNNPVMGLLADLVMQPETGYMAHEMPDRIIYDPEQMNSIEAFSLYYDPWTKQQPKTNQEQLEVCLAAIVELQSKSVDQLYREGFILDYDTKVYVGKYLWDNIATLNEQWAELEQSGALNYYVAGDGDYEEGRRAVSELKQQHYNTISEIKSLYYDKLWADELKSPAQYNQLHTQWAQDDNGNWYATGYYPSWFLPVTFAPTETKGGYQYVMAREEDWDTESIVTGDSTGQRGLVPREIGKVSTPNIESWSQDGTNTGHSDIYGSNDANATSSGKTTYPRTFGSGGGRSGGGGGGGGGYGSRGGSSAPNAYAPSISLPRANVGRIMNTDRLVNPDYEYLRPDFETKGSREAYRRSDI